MRQCRAEGLAGLAAVLLGVRGCRVRDGGCGDRERARLCCSGFFPTLCASLSAPFSPAASMAVSRAQVQQEPTTETSEGTGINITCSHPNIQSNDYIQWYRQFPGRGPAFLVSAFKDTKDIPDPPGRLWVSADRRSSALWLARPRLGDAAVYYCAVNPREAKPGLRPGTNRGG
ncbi:UNVERIFIED_CONTAM: hypothetical protein H355_015133, partial [Colinus virginianus]